MKILIVFAFLFSIGFVLTADAYVEVNYTHPTNPLGNYQLEYESDAITFHISDQINSTNWVTLVTEPRVISDYVSFCLAEETTRIMPSLTLYGSGSRIHTWGADSVVIDVPSEDENIIFMYYVYCFQPNGTVGVPIVFLNYDFDRSAYDDRLNPNTPTATLTSSVNELNILYAKLTVAYNNLKQIVGQENIQIKNYQDQKDLELQQINQKYSLLIANATADATVKKNKIQTEQIDPLTISANATKHQLIALNGGTLPSGVILPILD